MNTERKMPISPADTVIYLEGIRARREEQLRNPELKVEVEKLKAENRELQLESGRYLLRALASEAELASRASRRTMIAGGTSYGPRQTYSGQNLSSPFPSLPSAKFGVEGG